MEYSVGALARLAGVSPRTIRFYDKIGLLSPCRINESGYRIYAEKEVDLLQQIMFFRNFGMELDTIKGLVFARDFDRLCAMEAHLKTLQQERIRIEKLISNAKKSIDAMKGEITVMDCEKFEGFKKELVTENERKYGKEIREAYGDEQVDNANAKIMNLTKQEYEKWKSLEQEIMVMLKQAVDEGDPAGELAQKTCELHKRWLSYCGVPYSKEYHKGLGLMYAQDERFAAYYDKAAIGGAKFLKEAIDIYCK